MSPLNRSIRVLASLLLAALLLTACSTTGAADPGGSADEVASDDQAIEWNYPAQAIPGVDQEIVGTGPKGAAILSGIDVARPRHVAVYLHHWTPYPPSAEAEAITELVEAGHTVVYPAYQDRDSGVDEYLSNAVAGLRAGLEALEFEPESVVTVGFTTGGALAFDLAAVAARSGLPIPEAAVAVNPGREPDGVMPRPDYSAIPSDTSLMTMHTPGSRIPETVREARLMLRLASSVSDAGKQFLQPSPAALNRDGWKPILDFISASRKR